MAGCASAKEIDSGRVNAEPVLTIRWCWVLTVRPNGTTASMRFEATDDNGSSFPPTITDVPASLASKGKPRDDAAIEERFVPRIEIRLPGATKLCARVTAFKTGGDASNGVAELTRVAPEI